MNTRLQVEHPVTELITGVDLVEEMIRSAAGEPLRLKQADVKLAGWAVEARVYAEDPTRGFLPSTGRLVKYRPPPEGDDHGITVRNDTGVYEGGEISIHYDPMIAKLVTHAPDRLGAIEAQATALDAFVIDGIRHNIPFLSALMQHPRWREGRLSTGFIAEEFPDGFHPLVAKGETELRLAVAAAHIDHTLNERKRLISGQLREPEQLRFELKRVVALGTSRIELEIDPRKDGVEIVLGDGRRVAVHSDWKPGDPLWRGTIDGVEIAVQARPILNGYALSHAGVAVDARVYTRREAALGRADDRAQGRGRLALPPLPDAGPRQGDRRQGRAGGEDGRAALHRRSDEDGERAERRTRRDDQDDPRQGGRFARGRCGYHGVRMTRARRSPPRFVRLALREGLRLFARACSRR